MAIPADDRFGKGPRTPTVTQKRIFAAVIAAIVALGVLGVLGVLAALAPGSSGSATAAGGCWYVNEGGPYRGAMAVHLPQCDGAKADLQRTVFVNSATNMVPGREPANAQEVCQMDFGDGPTGWIGVWADSTNQTAVGAAQELCQMNVNENGKIRWSNFH